MTRLFTSAFALLTMTLAGTAAANPADDVSLPEPDRQVIHQGGGLTILDDGMTLVGEQRTFVPVDLPPDQIYVPPTDGTTAHAPPSRTLFVNFCQPNGCIVKPGRSIGREDSRSNYSSIVSGTSNRTLQAYSGSASTRAAILQCVRETYAPFNIDVTDVDPCPDPNSGCTTSHWETMAAGRPGDVGFPSGVAGVSPFTCGVIPNAITFNFINLFPSNVYEACWTIAQESAHAFGLSHEMLGTDPMTYISNPPRKYFQNEYACIGTQGCCQPSQECQCGDTQQNSYQEILTIFGTSTPTPPTINITEPANNAQVTQGFIVRADVQDNNGVARVELLIDNVVQLSLTSGPYAFNAPQGLAEGAHLVAIRATDTLGTAATAQINVIIGEPCRNAGDCEAQGQGLVCVDGRCVPGSGVDGGLGTACDAPTDCLSGVCVGSAGENYCSEQCDPSADGCPSGFHCANSGDTGYCWPGDSGCLGCSTDGNDPTLPIGVGLLAAALVVRRRRRRAA